MSQSCRDVRYGPAWTPGLALLLVIVLWASPAGAQMFRGSVSGTVTDSQGARLPGVRATLTNQDTNVSNEFIANEAGIYVFSAVDPGVYTLEFRMDGFETQRFENLVVSTSQGPTVNPSMKPGGPTTVVSITEAVGAGLDKTSPTVQLTVGGALIPEIPVGVARDITRLAVLAPIVSRSPGQNEFSANGQRSRNTNFTIDGVDANDHNVTVPGLLTPQEAIQEFSIKPVNFSAEFGRNTGAQINAITKSGTNAFHGEIWNYYRGNRLEPLSLTSQRIRLTESPRLVHNQFGVDVGGPIVRNRTFFFGLVQGNLKREGPNPANAQPVIIPTPAGYATLTDSTLPLRLPSQLGPPAQSAESRRAVLDALSFLPEVHALVGDSYESLPAVPVNGTPIEVGLYRVPIAQPHNLWYSVLRIDHQINGADKILYRYHIDDRDQPDSAANSNLGFGTRWSASQKINSQNHSVSYTKILGSHFSNELRGAYTRRDLDFPERDPLSASVFIRGLLTPNGCCIGGSSSFPQARLEQVYQIQSVSTYLQGRHTLKFGTDLRRVSSFARNGANTKGTWVFASLEGFLNNAPSQLVQAVTEPQSINIRQLNQAYFIQDNVRVTPSLTLDFGLRYETSSVPFGFFGATREDIRAVGVPGPTKRDKNNWAPRLGFAYSPRSASGVWGKLLGDGESSIRGGFGVAYDVLFYNIPITTAVNYPRSVVQDDRGPSLWDRFPTLNPKTISVCDGGSCAPLDPLATFVSVPEDAQNPTTHFWTLSVQRQLGRRYFIELGYSGNRSYHMIRQTQANPPILTEAQAAQVIATGNPNAVVPARLNPSWGSRQLVETTGKGEYHAGYVRFDRKLASGLAFGGAYTWSANFSDSEEAFAVPDISSSSPQVPQDFFNYRNEWSRSVFDRPHRFSIYYQYEVPSFTSRALRLLGGWQISGFTDFQSGQPFTIRVGVDTLGNAASGSFPPGRPDFNPGGILIKDPETNDLRSFTIPLDGTGVVTAPRAPNGQFLANSMPKGGNLGRNTFRGPAFQNWNLRLSKRVALPREGWRLQISADFNNLLNHDNFLPPEANMNSPAFGKNSATPITDARQVQLGAKITF